MLSHGRGIHIAKGDGFDSTSKDSGNGDYSSKLGITSNPVELIIMPVDCRSDPQSTPTADGQRCTCVLGTSKQLDGLCRACAAGKYARSFGALTCFASDFQHSQLVKPPEGLPCLTCPSCMNCFNGVPHIKAGWSIGANKVQSRNIAVHAHNVNAFHCPRVEVCPAGALSVTHRPCGNGTYGKFCAACSPGFFRSRSTKSCVSCDVSAPSNTSTWIVIGAALCVLTVTACTNAAKLADQAGIKIVLGYLQVMTQLGSVLNLDFPALLPTLSAVLKSAGSLFFGVSDLFRRVRCSLKMFVMDVVGVPLILLSCVYLKYFLLDYNRVGKDEAQHVRRISSFFVAFMLYPSISHKIFSVFVCRKFGPDDNGWLEEDYSISCGSDKYLQLRSVATGLVVLIPVGLPVILTVLLRKRKRRLEEYRSLAMGSLFATTRDELRAQDEVSADKAHRDWPWKDRFPSASEQMWIAAVAPSSIAHISERGVSATFLRWFTETATKQRGQSIST